MTIKDARRLARTLASLVDGVVRCDFHDMPGMTLTATEFKSFIDRWNGSASKCYEYKQDRDSDTLGCIPYRWRAKPRGASRDEWQPLPEDYVLETYNKYQ